VAAPAVGLTDEEVAARRRAGQGNAVDEHTSRSLGEIVRANIATRFNAILGGLLVVILVVGPIQDALFGVVLVANALIGIAQELRAKRTLDRLAILAAPDCAVVRGGRARRVPSDDVVLDDVLALAAGDQIVADAVVLDVSGLEVDESLLSGEAAPVAKRAGDDLLGGSFVAAGTGTAIVTGVGAASYARRLAAEARRFGLVRSELRAGIDTILRLVTWLLAPAAVLLVTSQMVANENVHDAVRGSVAGIGAMVPEGLVLLTSVASAVGIVRLGRRRVVVQELAALEGLARVDILCIDKTGTLTAPELDLVAVDVLDAGAPDGVLAALAAADPSPNATMRAIAADLGPVTGWAVSGTVPFSSARKWSATTFENRGSWVIGAPEVILTDRHEQLLTRVEERAAAGQRVLLVARAPNGVTAETLPLDLEPTVLAFLEERIRSDAADTLAWFAAEDVTVKVLSGDHPATVESVAVRVGLPSSGAIDARDLPEDLDQLAALAETTTVFGRVVPHQKRAIIAALQRRGHVVAMTGDGVNDVLALKDADIGVAMGSGTAASRSVARVVLLDDAFSALPAVVAEGRRVIGNVERLANLFLTKTVYAFALAVAVGVARLPFPFLPRQLTIISSLTIGIPAFFLALAPNPARARPGFVARSLRFAVPAGLVAAAATFTAYALARNDPGTTGDEARTTAVLVLFAVALQVLVLLARPTTRWRRTLVLAMVGLFLAAIALPAGRRFFDLDLPDPVVVAAAVGVAAVADLLLGAGWRLAERVRHPVAG
jgi:cation-transporting ATPase E